jgi:hypothetical protein
VLPVVIELQRVHNSRINIFPKTLRPKTEMHEIVTRLYTTFVTGFIDAGFGFDDADRKLEPTAGFAAWLSRTGLTAWLKPAELAAGFLAAPGSGVNSMNQFRL